MSPPQILFKPKLSLPNVRRARIVRPVGKPQGDVAAVQMFPDLDGIFRVLQRMFPHAGIGVTKRSVLIGLILKEIRIDGTGTDAVATADFRDAGDALAAIRKVPLDV